MRRGDSDGRWGGNAMAPARIPAHAPEIAAVSSGSRDSGNTPQPWSREGGAACRTTTSSRRAALT